MSFDTLFEVPTPLAAAERFQHRLELLGCPITENAPISWVQEVLFSQGENRIELLKWLLSKIVDEKEISAFLLKTKGKNYSPTDQKEEFVSAAILSLGVAKKQRVDFVKGTLPFLDQFTIWETVTRLAHAKWQLDETLTDTDNSKLKEVLDFLNAKEGENFQQIQRLPHLFPPHVKLPQVLNQEFPSIEQLVSESEDLARKMENCNIKQQQMNKLDGQQVIDDSMKDLLVAKENLIGVISNFTAIYEKDLKNCCREMKQPQISNAGEQFEKLHIMLSHLNNILEAACVVRSFLSEHNDNNAQDILEEFLQTFCNRKGSIERQVRILEESIKCKKGLIDK